MGLESRRFVHCRSLQNTSDSEHTRMATHALVRRDFVPKMDINSLQETYEVCWFCSGETTGRPKQPSADLSQMLRTHPSNSCSFGAKLHLKARDCQFQYCIYNFSFVFVRNQIRIGESRQARDEMPPSSTVAGLVRTKKPPN